MTLTLALFVACGGGDSSTATPSLGVVTATSTRASSASPTPQQTSVVITGTPGRTATPSAAPTFVPQPVPAGFPIDPNTHLGVVVGDIGSRQLVLDGSGPTAYDYALNDQPSDDPNRANRSGWNCATHYEYEGAPAVDFYLREDTPIIATMDGTATLNIISPENDFDRYGIPREPYIGNPDRSRAPVTPFPGPSGGLGVYVHIEDTDYVTEYGHLDIDFTLNSVPDSAFSDGYDRNTNYHQIFAGAPEPRLITTIATWYVHKGDVIGMSGDAGYSEGPHLHYTVAHLGGSPRCPTNEAGFSDGGWLFK
ncbi:MAG: M23 family metallopeptidase [Chloroflexota bacterium]